MLMSSRVITISVPCQYNAASASVQAEDGEVTRGSGAFLPLLFASTTSALKPPAATWRSLPLCSCAQAALFFSPRSCEKVRGYKTRLIDRPLSAEPTSSSLSPRSNAWQAKAITSRSETGPW